MISRQNPLIPGIVGGGGGLIDKNPFFEGRGMDTLELHPQFYNAVEQ